MATTNLNLPLISDNMSADVVRDMNALAEAVDSASATTSTKGHVQLSSDTNSDSEVLAATAKAVKTVNDSVTAHAGTNASTSSVGHVQLNDTLTSTSTEQAATTNAVKTVNDALTAHKSDETVHGIGDKTTLLTTEQSTIVGAVNELFTNVSDGKDLVGTAITDVDASVVVPTNPTFQDLATAVGQISTGKKWASGTGTYSKSGTFNITGLDFKPNTFVFFSSHLTTSGYLASGYGVVSTKNNFTYYTNSSYKVIGGYGCSSTSRSSTGGGPVISSTSIDEMFFEGGISLDLSSINFYYSSNTLVWFLFE